MLDRLRRVEIVLGLLLAAVSFAPWWADRADPADPAEGVDGGAASAWTGPHFSWLAILLCLAVVAARSLPRPRLGERWAAAGVVVALVVVLAGAGSSPDDGSHQLAWVLQEQGADSGSAGVAWGCPAGVALMVLLLAALTAGAVRRSGGDGGGY